MTTSFAAPPHAVAHVTGRTGALSVVPAPRGRYDVLAGSASMTSVDATALAAFGRDVLSHLETRQAGVRVSVSADDAFPASVSLVHDGVSLRLLDDGDLVTVMAFSGTAKGGAGTGVRLDDVRTFARALRDLA